MIIRTMMPSDTAFCIDTDVEPWYLWGQIPYDWVVKVLELSQPVGFLVYKFEGNSVILLKLCIREDLRRTGLGTEALHWLINRSRTQGYIGVECELKEEQALGKTGASPIVELLRSCGFAGKLVKNRYVFKRNAIC